MEILKVTEVTDYIIETDDEEYPTWRRGSDNPGLWENLMGESWEGLEPPEGLEENFKRFILKT